MTKTKGVMRILIESALLVALVIGLVLGIKAWRGQGQGRAGGVAAAEANTPQSYSPTPSPTEGLQPIVEEKTPVVADAPPTLTPWPTFTPYPSPTLGSGPTSTPIPLAPVAKDAAGSILYFASEEKDAAVAYVLAMDANGSALGTAQKLSEAMNITWGRAYPSPDGQRVAFVGDWGAGSILYTDSGKTEWMFRDTLSPLGKFFNWHPDNHTILIHAGNNYPDLGLWLVDTDTLEHIALAVTGYGSTRGGAVSPDGKKVVYSYEKDIFSPGEV